MINMGSAITLNHCTFQSEIEALIEVNIENVPNKPEIPVERQYQAIKRTRMLNDLRMAFFMSIYAPLLFTGLTLRLTRRGNHHSQKQTGFNPGRLSSRLLGVLIKKISFKIRNSPCFDSVLPFF